MSRSKSLRGLILVYGPVYPICTFYDTMPRHWIIGSRRF